MVQGIGGLGSLYSAFRSGFFAGVGAAGSASAPAPAPASDGNGSSRPDAPASPGGAGMDYGTMFQQMDSSMRSYMLKVQSERDTA